MKPPRIEMIDREYAVILRSKTPAEKAAMINDCWLTARALLGAGERMRHPDWTEEQIEQAVSRRLLDGAN